MILTTYLVEKCQDEFAILCIEITCRLVGKDDFRVVQDGTGNTDTLLFATGKLVDELVLLVGKLHHLEHFDDSLLAFGFLLPACRAEYEVEITMHSTVSKQLEVLEDDAHLLPEGRLMLCLEASHVEAKHFCLATFDGQLAIDSLEERRLAAANRTCEVHHLAFFDAEVHFLEDKLVVLIDIDISIIQYHLDLFNDLTIYYLRFCSPPKEEVREGL